MKNHGNILSYTALILFLITTSSAYNSICNINQYITQSYIFSSPGYPSYYDVGTSCRWHLTAAANKQINVQCNDVQTAKDDNCTDRIVISYSGDINLKDGDVYCGSGTMNLMSNANAITIAIFSNKQRGRLSCIAYAIQAVQPQTTPKPNCDCGWKQKHRIVGGEETGINEFPFMAGLVRLDYGIVWCGAVIISPRHVLTAAHCPTNIPSDKLSVLIGDHNIEIGNETSPQLISVAFITIHPNYNNKTQENDIAVLKLLGEITYTINIGPICLPYLFRNLNTTSVQVTVLGWGTTEFSGPRSDYLQEVNLTVISNTKCQKDWDSQKTILSSQICTYAEGKDACQFDSGGPVIMWDWTVERYQLLGLVSNGFGCASSIPGVNTRVTSFLDWITNETRDYSLCVK